MPYIHKKYRKEFDPLIDTLAEKIASAAKEEKSDGAFAGFLNYASTRLALKIIRLRFGNMRYWILAMVTGVFKNIADELYRRIGARYEDIQIEKNGDVDLYEEYLKELH